MTHQENKAIVRRFVEEAQGKGNLDLIDEVLAETFVDHDAFPGVASSREGVRSLFTAFHTAFPDFKVTLHDQVAENDLVVNRKTQTGTHQGPLLGIPATGRPVSLNVIEMVRLADGRITDHWTVFDQSTLMRQLGKAS